MIFLITLAFCFSIARQVAAPPAAASYFSPLGGYPYSLVEPHLLELLSRPTLGRIALNKVELNQVRASESKPRFATRQQGLFCAFHAIAADLAAQRIKLAINKNNEIIRSFQDLCDHNSDVLIMMQDYFDVPLPKQLPAVDEVSSRLEIINFFGVVPNYPFLILPKGLIRSFFKALRKVVQGEISLSQFWQTIVVGESSIDHSGSMIFKLSKDPESGSPLEYMIENPDDQQQKIARNQLLQNFIKTGRISFLVNLDNLHFACIDIDANRTRQVIIRDSQHSKDPAPIRTVATGYRKYFTDWTRQDLEIFADDASAEQLSEAIYFVEMIEAIKKCLGSIKRRTQNSRVSRITESTSTRRRLSLTRQ